MNQDMLFVAVQKEWKRFRGLELKELIIDDARIENIRAHLPSPDDKVSREEIRRNVWNLSKRGKLAKDFVLNGNRREKVQRFTEEKLLSYLDYRKIETSPEYQRKIASEEWATFSKDMIAHYGFCVICRIKSTQASLCCHHINYGPDLSDFFLPRNILVVCSPCHSLIHWRRDQVDGKPVNNFLPGWFDEE